MRVGMGKGVVRGTFTAPVSDRVCGGLCCSDFSTGQPMAWATDGLGLLGYVPVRRWTLFHPIHPPAHFPV